MTSLFSTFTLKGLELKNRVMMSPMVTIRAEEKTGEVNNWHHVHYLSRIVGGVGLVMLESTAIASNGMTNPRDLGLYNDIQEEKLTKLVQEAHALGGKIAIQLNHSGRKAPADDDFVAPSAIPFYEGNTPPKELTFDEIQEMIHHFKNSTERAVRAGFDAIELHAAHGYLVEQFLSPISNHRDDEYGGSFEKRLRFATDVIHAMKSVMPEDMPLFMRVSATEYDHNGYGIEDMIQMCQVFKEHGVDMIDVSSGGAVPTFQQKIYPGYQLPLSNEIKQNAFIPTIAVGKLEEPHLAEHALQTNQADLIAIARGLLRNPYWTIDAALKLGANPPIDHSYTSAYPE